MAYLFSEDAFIKLLSNGYCCRDTSSEEVFTRVSSEKVCRQAKEMHGYEPGTRP